MNQLQRARDAIASAPPIGSGPVVALVGSGVAGQAARAIVDLVGSRADRPLVALDATPRRGEWIVLSDETGWSVPRCDPDVGDRWDLVPLVLGGLATLGRGGVIPDPTTSFHAALDRLAARLASVDAEPKPITRIARPFDRRLALVTGGGPGAVAAESWATQIRRSAKTLAVAHTFPGAAGDEVSAWGQHGDVTRNVIAAAVLRHGDEPRHVAAQLDRYQAVLEEVVADVVVVLAEGTGVLERFVDLVVVGELVGVAIATAIGLDPVPEPAPAEYQNL